MFSLSQCISFSPAAAPVASQSIRLIKLCTLLQSSPTVFIFWPQSVTSHWFYNSGGKLVFLPNMCSRMSTTARTSERRRFRPQYGKDTLPHTTYYKRERLLWVSRLQIIIISFTTVINSFTGASLARINAHIASTMSVKFKSSFTQ